MDEPLDAVSAKKLIGSILDHGTIRFSGHAYEEMDRDGIDEVDVIGVLRAGIVDGADLERGSWRYRLRTFFLTVVIAFRSETAAVVVTAWRNGS